MVAKHIGSNNVKIEDLKIINHKEQYSIIFEQLRNSLIRRVCIEGNGGIVLANKSIGNIISKCKIKVLKARGINLEYFCNGNNITENSIDYNDGGDTAIMAMMSCYNNIFQNNFVKGDGLEQVNEIGIAIHTTSYNNIIKNNKIKHTAEGLGTFFRATNNMFYNNKISHVPVGYLAYYSSGNQIFSNKFIIHNLRKKHTIGLNILNSNNEHIYENTLSGTLAYGFVFDNSQRIFIKKKCF